MNVVIINHSDNKGGASVVSVRLLQALNSLGVDARMLVVDETLGNPRIQKLQPKWRVRANFLAEHVQLFIDNGFCKKNIFKLSTGAWGMPIHNHPWIKEADVVVMEWINQGMLRLLEICKIGVPVVWVMHDMWEMTGICHHAGECTNFEEECGNCCQLQRPRTNDISRKTWQCKREVYKNTPITFVAVSNWLRKKARESTLLKDQDVRSIPNPFPVEKFSLNATRPRNEYKLPECKRLIVMGAARLDDPIKGLDIAIQALNKLEGEDVCAVFFGAIREPGLLQQLRVPYRWLGAISDTKMLSDIYAHADVVMSASHWETLPTTLIEGMASGCVPVCFNQGGQADIVEHLRTGYIAKHPDVEDLASGLRWAINTRIDPEMLRKDVEEKFSALTIAKRYIDLFNDITNNTEI